MHLRFSYNCVLTVLPAAKPDDDMKTLLCIISWENYIFSTPPCIYYVTRQYIYPTWRGGEKLLAPRPVNAVNVLVVRLVKQGTELQGSLVCLTLFVCLLQRAHHPQ